MGEQRRIASSTSSLAAAYVLKSYTPEPQLSTTHQSVTTRQ
jgi:hypothetical protein